MGARYAAVAVERSRPIDGHEVVRLADCACRFMGPNEALELCRNIVCVFALRDPEPVETVIRAMLEHRVANFGLNVRVEACVAALTESWRTR